MDRIEREHEEFRAELRQLLAAQVIQKTEIEDLLKITQEHTRQMQQQTANSAFQAERLDKLVVGIADLIRRIPPENLR